jgi:hypothetical protein
MSQRSLFTSSVADSGKGAVVANVAIAVAVAVAVVLVGVFGGAQRQ